MASDEFRHASQQEALNVSSPMRTNRNEIGVPFRCSIEDAFFDVPYFDSGVCLESRSTQLVRNSLDQCMGWLLLFFQLRSVPLSHFRRSHGLNRLEHVQNQNFGILGPELVHNSLNHIFGKL